MARLAKTPIAFFANIRYNVCMKKIILVTTLLFGCTLKHAPVKPKAFNVKPTHLAAIAIVESGFGRYARTRLNRNGTIDRGVFQINSVNNKKCAAFNLDTVEGNAFCAAFILSHMPDVASYHSRTPSKKMIYSKKIAKVLKTGSDK